MSDEISGEDEVRREVARRRAQSIGPIGSAVMMGDTLDVFFKVKWGRLRPVEEFARERGEEMMDSYSKWGMHVQGDTRSASLELGWPDVGVHVHLFFELPKWRTELDLVHHAGGVLTLCPVNAKDVKEIIARGISIQVESDLLPTILHSP